MPLVCEFAVNERYSVRLTVSQNSHEADWWDWTCLLQSGYVIGFGKMPTKIAAQVEGQRAYEAWFFRNRRMFRTPPRIAYQWKEVE